MEFLFCFSKMLYLYKYSSFDVVKYKFCNKKQCYNVSLRFLHVIFFLYNIYIFFLVFAVRLTKTSYSKGPLSMSDRQ